MIEVHLDTTYPIEVIYYKEDSYYVVTQNESAICSFYTDLDNRPNNSVLCFANSKSKNCEYSYITFYKNHLEVLHNKFKLTTLQYTEEDIKEAFSILNIKIKEVT